MANSVRTGFWPIDNFGYGVPLIRVRVASSNVSLGIFKGDCVQRLTAGTWDAAVGTTTPVSGVGSVMQGAEYVDAQKIRRGSPYLPGSTTYTSTGFDRWLDTDESFIQIVADMVGTEFEATYSISTPVAGDFSKNSQVNDVLVLGSTSTGLSGHQLDQATINTTATFPWTLIRPADQVGNDRTVINSRAVCRLNAATSGAAFPPIPITGTIGL